MSKYERMGDTGHTSRIRFANVIVSLFAFGICGVAGVLVDLDHPAARILGLGRAEHGSVAGEIMGQDFARFLHIPVLIICCGVLWYLIAYRRRLLGKMVLAVDPVRKGKKVRLDG
jgi:hypothetical protein